MLYPIDLGFLGLERGHRRLRGRDRRRPRALRLRAVDDAPAPARGPAPSSTSSLGDIRHLLLSHIHFDHAGAAGPIVREHPGLTVWVSEVGAPSPGRPVAARGLGAPSLRRLVRHALGRARAGARAQHPRSPTATSSAGRPSRPPGHASHHVCYLRDGTLLAGDACGVRPQPARYIVPPTPPPDIDLEAWHATIARSARREPERLALTHFGVECAVGDHLDRLEAELDRWAALVRDGMGREEFAAAGEASVGDDRELCRGSRRLRPVLAGPPALLGQARRARALGRRLTGRLSPRGGGLGRRSTGRSTSPRARRRPCAAGR